MDASASVKMAPVAAAFVITGPSGVGKGTLIRALCASASPSSSSRPRRRRGRRGRARRTASTTTSSAPRTSSGGSRPATSSSTPTYSGNRYGTLRSEVEERTARGAPVLLEIEVQGARQVRESMPEAVQIFIAPPDAADLRRRLEGRGTDSAETIEGRLRVAEEELAAQGEFRARGRQRRRRAGGRRAGSGSCGRQAG